MYMVLMTVLPFLFLSILNALIVVRQSSAAKKEQRALQRLQQLDQQDGASTSPASERTFSGGSIGSPAAQDSGSDDTITMIMVVVLFLACNTLVSLSLARSLRLAFPLRRIGKHNPRP